MVIIMKYEILFVNNEFKEIIDDKLVQEMLEMKDDEFNHKQFQYFFLSLTKSQIIQTIKDRLNNRNDIIIDDEIIIYKNQITNEVSKITFLNDKAFIDCERYDNPLILALNNSFNVLLHEINC